MPAVNKVLYNLPWFFVQVSLFFILFWQPILKRTVCVEPVSNTYCTHYWLLHLNLFPQLVPPPPMVPAAVAGLEPLPLGWVGKSWTTVLLPLNISTLSNDTAYSFILLRILEGAIEKENKFYWSSWHKLDYFIDIFSAAPWTFKTILMSYFYKLVQAAQGPML